jgi:predicted TPR repeat methyltransferase
MYRPLTGQDKVTAEWQSMAGEWDDIAGGYRDCFVKLMWEETGYTDAPSRKDLVVLDFGCATGLLAEAIHKDIQRYIGIDVAGQMLEIFQNKIRAGDWQNVEAHCAALAHLERAEPNVQKVLESLKGKVDIIAASSVLNFIPEEDVETTMNVLSSLLKSGTGILCHSDWPKSEMHPDGFTEEKAKEMYQKSGLQAKFIKQTTVKMGGQKTPVFVGTAVKSP